ncbi:GATA transcription factor LreB [Aspergillus puulaauensis]|uniref:Blue light receptor n=1 Tax=Aspergillus puulaauensis TaxID=1220207 RepID=A0A7R7XT30_9EURO|nr:blue light receptor [Aspergillus puulaauensis]BCS27217.1 blue light receptor [Aspergillus puulaauensis]
MDLTQLPLTQAPNPYGLETEIPSATYEGQLGIPQIPYFLNAGFNPQSSSFNQSSLLGLPSKELPWPQRVLDEVRDLLLLLTTDGTVNYVSPSYKAITGFEATQLEHGRLSRVIHDDDKAVFTRELRECIATGRLFRCHFRMCKADKSTCVMEAHGHPHFSTLNADGNQGQICHGVFLVCRPYHTESTRLLDSFIEHKLENIRLKERIAQLKKEEDDSNPAPQQKNPSQVPSSASHRPNPVTNKVFQNQPSQSNVISSLESSMIPSEDKESSDTLGNMDELELELDMNQARAALDDEGPSSHLDDIELLTGLFLTEGERAQGISTGIPDGHLYHFTGTTNPPNPIEQEQDQQAPPENEPRKRLKGEYQCADCGTSDSPEWRKGPGGPKTLCNACGLRWAKREKKRHDS